MIPDGASTRNEVAIASNTCLTRKDNPTGALQLGYPLYTTPQAAIWKRVTVSFPWYDLLNFT